MKSKSIGYKLMEALTKDQIVHVLDATFTLWENQKIDELLKKLNKDVATTLSRVLYPETPSPQRLASDEKYIEEWNHFWDEWHEIILEVGDEEGKYAYQEHHWEQPYFDGYSLTSDLDKIAEKMLPLMNKIHELRVEDDKLFEKEIVDIEYYIGEYPEWMGAEHEECDLDSAATQCVLRWEWLAANSAETFVNRIIEIEKRLSIIELDREAFNDFFKSLPEDVKKQIYEHITSNRNSPTWEERLKSSHSKWHQIFHAFSMSFNPGAYLDNCRRMLHENWRYGLPLIKDLTRKEDYAGAEKVSAQSITSFLGRGADKIWQPEESLLITVLKYGYGSPQTEIVKLLKDWIMITEKLNLAERTTALKLQLVTYKQPNEWDAVTKVFKEINLPLFSSTATKLIRQWQSFILTIDLGESFRDDKEPDDCWIRWLMETGLEKVKDKKWFEKKVKDWLKSLCQNHSTQSHEQQKFISILTRDLADIYALKKQHPNLYKIVSRETYGYKKSIASRQAWLGKMQGDQFIPLIIECWMKNVMKLIPDPSHAHKSVYDEHALWLAVVRELNPPAYQKVIAQWKVNHGRRKNLWEAIRKQDLPV